MLKNKFKIITLLLVIILAVSAPFVRAENETDANNASNQETMPISTEGDPGTVTDNAPTDDTFKKSDVYLTGDNVTVDYIVDGNLFVAANTVTIKSQIGGDAFIIANKVIVEEQGYIFSNLFTVSQDVEIKGVVYDVYALSKNVSINGGYIYRDFRVSSSSVTIAGAVGRNAFITSENITFPQENTTEGEQTTSKVLGVINGNFNYTAKNEISFPEGSVAGDINYTKPTVNTQNLVQKYLMSMGTLLATVIIIWLLCLWVAPKFLKETNTIATKKLFPVVGLGVLAPIATVIVSAILLALGITSTIGLLMMTLFFVCVVISSSVFIIMVNNLICNKLKIEKTIGIFGMLIASTVVFFLLRLIPYVSFLVGLIALVVGLGTILYYIFIYHKKGLVEKTEKVKTEKRNKKYY